MKMINIGRPVAGSEGGQRRCAKGGRCKNPYEVLRPKKREGFSIAYLGWEKGELTMFTRP